VNETATVQRHTAASAPRRREGRGARRRLGCGKRREGRGGRRRRREGLVSRACRAKFSQEPK